MEFTASNIVFLSYIIIGSIVLYFSKQISSSFYNIVLIYTNKTKLKDTYLFRVDHKNEKIMFSVARAIIIVYFGILVVMSIYYLVIINDFFQFWH